MRICVSLENEMNLGISSLEHFKVQYFGLGFV